VGPAPRRASLLQGLRLVIRQRSLMLVTFGNMLVGLSFAGAVVTFFPLYGEQLLISQAAIGTMFSVRAIVSTLGRFPNGILASLFGNQTVMLSALFVQATVMLGIARTTNPTMLTVLLAIEGLAFGAYLVSGQTFVANNTTAETRGTAVGVYSMVSSIGRALSPFGLGLIAQRWGVASVFSVTGWMLGVGFVISVIGTILLARRSLDVQTPAVPDTSG
jgi:MFS family permease